MRFLHSAFIENTPEMREWLEGIGYEILNKDFIGDYLLSGYALSKNYTPFESKDLDWFIRNVKPIDCRSNSQLFKAVTAMREDSDYMQWFTDGVKWVISNVHTLLCLKDYFKEIGFDVKQTHKATLKELKEYFKTEGI